MTENSRHSIIKSLEREKQWIAMKSPGSLFIKFAFAFLLLGLALFSLYELFVPAGPLKGRGVEAMVDVPPGRGFDQLARELEEKGLIRHALSMRILARAWGSPPLMAGEYKISSGESLWRQFHKLKGGEVHYFSVTFAEGLNHYEIWSALKSEGWPQAEDFLKIVRSKKLIKELLGEERHSFEGYLFPETYAVTKYMGAESLLRLMVGEFLKAYREARPSSSRLSRHEAVTFASLIEKETGAPEERPRISSVFHNRLKKGMKLQTDPTILYSLYLAKGFSHPNSIRKRDILFESPYNTYVVHGLPPGPIASPGKESLRAVFFPEATDYLYFVSRNDGTHFFSKTRKEHEKAVYEYQIKPFRKKQR